MSPPILIIEDHADNRRILRDLLTRAGYTCQEAVTGCAGCRLAEAQPPALILLDLQLPGLDGYAVARRLKAHPALQAVPLLAMTAYALRGDEARALAAGCDGYVTKPFSPRALLATIRQYLS